MTDGCNDSVVWDALKEFDEPLKELLKEGAKEGPEGGEPAIRLLDAKKIRGDETIVMVRRQQLPPHLFVSPDVAIECLEDAKRSIGVLSYGWRSSLNPDPDGRTMQALRAWLLSKSTGDGTDETGGEHVKCVFVDFMCVHQEPRSTNEAALFKRALEGMSTLYASPLGTVVARYSKIPGIPDALVGATAIAGVADNARAQLEACFDEMELGPRQLEKQKDCDLWRADFQMPAEKVVQDFKQKQLRLVNLKESLVANLKESLEQLDAGLLTEKRFEELCGMRPRIARDKVERFNVLLVASARPWYNRIPYHKRGWGIFETAASGEVTARAFFFGDTQKRMRRLPFKLVEINDDGSKVEAVYWTKDPLICPPNSSFKDTGIAERSVEIAKRLETEETDLETFSTPCATYFSRKEEDREHIVRLYRDLGTRLNNMLLETDKLELDDGNPPTGFTSFFGDGHEKKGKPESGKGKLWWIGGSSYEGEIRNGEPNGYGVFQSAGRAKYEGEWKDGQMHTSPELPIGVYVYPDGDKYEGPWVNGQKHGKGICTYKDGTEHVGFYTMGRRNGPGLYCHTKHSHLPGCTDEILWKDNKIVGEGIRWERLVRDLGMKPAPGSKAWLLQDGDFKLDDNGQRLALTPENALHRAQKIRNHRGWSQQPALTQEQATAYVQEHQLQRVISEMLNALLPTGTLRPLSFMSNYLADRAAADGE